MKTAEDRNKIFVDLALDFNASMPREVMLKGDGSIWIVDQGAPTFKPRKISKQEAIEIIHRAIRHGEITISV